MLFKTLFTLSFVTAAAFATTPPRVLGEITVSGGGPLPPTVKPSTYTCTVLENATHQEIRVGGRIDRQVTTGTTYDADVPESRAFISLARSAAAGPIVQRQGPTDVPTRRYVAYTYDATLGQVELGSYGPRIFTNESAAAKTLRAFLDRNCQMPPG